MFSRTAFALFSSASPILGRAVRFNTHIVKRKRTSVQIIRPRPGETRKLPPSSVAATGSPAMSVTNSTGDGLEEEGDQTEDERVEGDSLGKREAEPPDRLELVLHLGLAGHRL